MSDDPSIKIVIVGDASVGKTAIMQKYCDGTFSITQPSTIGSTCSEKEVKIDNNVYKLSIWDTAGQETYRTIVPMYFRGAACAIVVFDITNQKSLDSVSYWVHTIRENASSAPLIFCCANKYDLLEERVIEDEEINITVNNLQIPVFYTSALTGAGIDRLFESILHQLVEKNFVKDLAIPAPVNTSSQKSGCAC
ncbi:small GTP-binding protein, putative [Trichomonas vaginalis G3]|uniref:Small GTP-binding protein, putative n=1 Tax=Trichomonas vaginalis (strain ATCC PRA-98 / G3) TaxID=412133 RepID=A2DY65_TRIV3|nr:GTPase protein [Trichomonas vaginalis G3]EAY14674.1 small GTP-binding protein, putative [Trichomonas vaginalis G3]KAI5505427.1 GTPase protein [Trichomonas vaginalis G3]|eukprot:XP_001326897.1 small GTP-binding protein [Trichomonas vaginalis G3]